MRLPLLFTLLALTPALAAPRCHSVTDQQAIKQLLADIDLAWQARDAARVAAAYTQDGSVGLQPDNSQAQGRANVQKFFAQVFKVIPANARHVMTVQQISAVGNLCAVDVRATIDLTAADGAHLSPTYYSGFWLVQPRGKTMQILAARAVQLPQS